MSNLGIKKGDKVVIIGGGFAGLQLATALMKADLKVILVDKQNHHQFQPLFYQVATGRLEPSSISFPFRKIFQKSKTVDFRMADITSIDPVGKRIMTAYDRTITYDHLVIATGCKTNFFGNKQMSENAFSMKTTEESIDIRNKILFSFEKEIFARPEDKQAWMNIIIVGAGATGVELSGAFAELKKDVLPKDYHNIDFSKFNIILLEGGKYTLNNMSEESKIASRKYLEEMGVIVKTETLIESYDGNVAVLNTGERIPTKNVIWAAGVTGNVIEGLEPEDTFRNRYIVDRYNKLKRFDNIYALGDVAYMETPKFPKGHPQVANVAINQAKNMGNNIVKSLKNEDYKPVEFEYHDLGMMATIGKHKAVVELPFIKFKGPVAWYVWMFLHLMLILSVRNKIIIFFNWAWSYLTKDTSLRLITKINYQKEKVVDL
ncbi:FAD-dependent pyridine nucleotide-disulfide oxidoreductase [Paludibacter propionicigenes WB4]|uniref:NADH:ubiquinone reductase (non-electrogenic) n=1 Tax=Paludibacter propionicigenes (strain DSM 17365 / JCM 13257 / WB4) TaxID=694427 RepID=E4T292_PALPW|nr:NAD(P)/FAD-dependent oxidoreductase [Paludibacter propionicigenes]ADQ78836.1 FAD-dependent pyridine nucleotide-disulfide oxidoreductase [Paludibacter propionicigenes WB4]